MRRIVGKIFIIVGILILSTVIYTNYTVSQANTKLVNQYKDDIKANQINKKNTDTEVLDDVVGILSIPKIDLEVVVKEGTDQETLKSSVGHFKETSLPGEYGNFAVAGHRAYTTNKFFSNLDKLEIGDELSVLSKSEVHTYKVDSIEVVEPENVEVIESVDKNKKEITLVTCTPKYVGSHRLVVKGKYIE